MILLLFELKILFEIGNTYRDYIDVYLLQVIFLCIHQIE